MTLQLCVLLGISPPSWTSARDALVNGLEAKLEAAAAAPLSRTHGAIVRQLFDAHDAWRLAQAEAGRLKQVNGAVMRGLPLNRAPR